MADIALFGAGHNSLVCAAKLASFGHEVTIYEQWETVGGALVNITLSCGCVASLASNTLKLMDGEMADILLYDKKTIHEFYSIPRHQGNFIVDGTKISVGDRFRKNYLEEMANLSNEPIQNIERFSADLSQASLLVTKLWKYPYATNSTFRNAFSVKNKHLFKAFVENSLSQTARHYFTTEIARQFFVGLSSLVAVSFETPGTSFCLLYLASGEFLEGSGFALPNGGMGHVASTLADSCRQRGVKFELHSKLTKLTVHEGSILNAVLEDGRVVNADAFVCGFSPAMVEDLIDKDARVTPFVDRRSYETGAVRIIGRIPRILERSYMRSAEDEPVVQTIISPNFSTFAQMTEEASVGISSKCPYVEISSTAALQENEGCSAHIPLSIYALYFPYTWCLSHGSEETKDIIASRVRNSIGIELPELAQSIEFCEILTPVDFEQMFGMYRGDVDHGSFSFGNLFESRGFGKLPHGATQYNKLFNCSSGIFPGGLVSGRPGTIAAETIMTILG